MMDFQNNVWVSPGEICTFACMFVFLLVGDAHLHVSLEFSPAEEAMPFSLIEIETCIQMCISLHAHILFMFGFLAARNSHKKKHKSTWRLFAAQGHGICFSHLMKRIGQAVPKAESCQHSASLQVFQQPRSHLPGLLPIPMLQHWCARGCDRTFC